MLSYWYCTLLDGQHLIILLMSTDSIASQMLTTFIDFHDKGDPVRIDTARIVSLALAHFSS